MTTRPFSCALKLKLSRGHCLTIIGTEGWRDRIGQYLERRRLRLHPRKTTILPSAESATFLGFVLMPGGWRRLPEDNIRRFRHRLRGLRDRYRVGRIDWPEVERHIRPWIAHAEHADSFRLREVIFRDAVFYRSR